jgi:deoxyhypusine synthase
MLPGTRAVELRRTNGIYKRLMEERLIKTLVSTSTPLHIDTWKFLSIFFLSIFFLSKQVFLYRGSLIFIGWFL